MVKSGLQILIVNGSDFKSEPADIVLTIMLNN
jgi:hypothetical protein